MLDSTLKTKPQEYTIIMEHFRAQSFLQRNTLFSFIKKSYISKRTKWLWFSTFSPTFPIYRFLIEWESWVFWISKLKFYASGVHLAFWSPSKILLGMWKTSIGAAFSGTIFKDMQILYWFKTCNVQYLHDTFYWHSIHKFEICNKYKF